MYLFLKPMNSVINTPALRQNSFNLINSGFLQKFSFSGSLFFFLGFQIELSIFKMFVSIFILNLCERSIYLDDQITYTSTYKPNSRSQSSKNRVISAAAKSRMSVAVYWEVYNRRTIMQTLFQVVQKQMHSQKKNVITESINNRNYLKAIIYKIAVPWNASK